MGALLLLGLSAAPVLAAILGALDRPVADPGDWVELTTVTGDGTSDPYSLLAASGPLPVFLQRADESSFGNSCDLRIGSLVWSGGVGTLRFRVPETPPGDYWVLAEVQGQCWRFGNVAGVLTLSVRGGPGTVPQAVLPLAVAAAIGFAAAAVAAHRAIRRRRTL